MSNDERVLLHINRFAQQPSECAIAAVSSLANYYDPSIQYSDVRLMLSPRKRAAGMFTSQSGRLLNNLGFKRVNIVTADLSMVDFSWADLPKDKIIEKLDQTKRYYARKGETYSEKWVADMLKWLSDESCENELIIDNDWCKYIKRHLNYSRPVGASVNWTATFKKTKYTTGNVAKDIGGESVEHCILVRGYDSKGVFVVDSHHRNYKGRWLKYSKGYYKLPWSRFLTNMPYGDLFWVS